MCIHFIFKQTMCVSLTDIDAGSTSYTLKDHTTLGRGPVSPLGGLGTSVSTSDMTGYGPHSSSNSANREEITNVIRMWDICLGVSYIWCSSLYLITLPTGLVLLFSLLLFQISAQFVPSTVVISTIAVAHT